jgi:hypothetical protein
MTGAFQPGGFATLIGSLPLADHGEATDLILEHTPQIKQPVLIFVDKPILNYAKLRHGTFGT